MFFLLAAYGAGVTRWCRDAAISVPSKWIGFYDEQRAIRRADAEQHPDKVTLLAGSRSCKRPVVTLQSHLNMEGERKTLNLMERVAKARGVVLDAPEHDGGWFRAVNPTKNWQFALLSDMQCAGFLVSWKPTPETFDELMNYIVAHFGEGDWTVGMDDQWITRCCTLLRAITLRASGSPPHMDFAEGIAHYFEGKLSRNRKLLEVWDERLCTWSSEDGETLLERLRPHVSKALHAEAGETPMTHDVICHSVMGCPGVVARESMTPMTP